MATEKIQIAVSEKGSTVVKRRLDAIGTSAEQAARRLRLLQRALTQTSATGADATRRLAVSTQRVAAAQKATTQSTGIFTQSLNNLTSSALSVTGALAGLSAGIAAIAAVSTLSSFGDQMATVRAITQSTEQEFQKLTSIARELGATTRFTGVQSGEALEQLARAGLSAKESMDTVRTVLKLAQAENLSLAEAAEVAAKSMRIFRLDVEDVPRVADLLSKAASSATTDVRQLFQALKFGGTIASGFKFDINETVAALTVLADAGQEATLGGTALRGILSRLAAPTKEFKKELLSIGIKIEELNPETHSLIQILRRLSQATNSTSTVFELFRQRAGTGFDILLKNVDKLETRMKDFKTTAEGTLDIKFGIKADTLANDLYTALSAVQELILAIGDAGLTAVLRTVLQIFSAGVRSIAAAIDALSPVIKAAGVAIAAAFVVKNVALFQGAIVSLTGAMWRLTAAMVAFAVSNPFTAIILAISVAIGGAIALFNQFGDKIRIAGTEYATLADVVEVIGKRISENFNSVVDFTVKVFTYMYDTIVSIAKKMADTFIKSINFIISALELMANTARTAINAVSGLLNLGTIEKLDFGKVALPTIETPDYIKGIVSEAEKLAKAREAHAWAANLETTALASNKAAQDNNNLASASANRLLETKKNLLQQITGPQENVKVQLKALNALYTEGKISLDQYNVAMRDLAVSATGLSNTIGGGLANGLAKVAQQANKLGEQVSNLVTDTFSKAADAIIEFAKTGKFNVKEFVSSVLEQLTRLALNQLFAQLVGLAFGGGAGAGLGGLLGGTGGGGLLGFATGGSMVVGGSGGTDSQLVAFRATPGERVDVSTPAQQREGGGGTQVNIINQAGAEIQQTQRRTAGGGSIVDIVVKKVASNMASGGFDNSMRGRFGAPVKQTAR